MSCESSFVYIQLNGFKYCYVTPMILSIKYFCLIQIMCSQLYCFKWLIIIIILSKWLNSSVWPIDRTIAGTIHLGQSVPGSNGKKEVLHFPKISRTGASPSDAIKCHTQNIHEGVFYNPQLTMAIWLCIHYFY